MWIIIIILLNISRSLSVESNKTKRGLDDQNNYYYGVPLTLRVIPQDLNSTPTTSNIRPVLLKTIENSVEPKPVAVQQVLYEYQQTPHNAVSNVHVNQQFQEPTNQYNAVITPIQHSTVINHTPHVNRYVYGNGKVFYYPLLSSQAAQLTTTPRPYLYNSGPVLNYQQTRPNNFPSSQFKPPTLIPFVTSQPIITKQPAPVRDIQEEKKEPSNENGEEDEVDLNHETNYNKYSEDDDDEEDDRFENYKHNYHNDEVVEQEDDEEDEDEDTSRSHSKYTQSRKARKPKQSNRHDYDNYYNKPKDYYKSNYSSRYYKSHSKNKPHKGKSAIEGRQSQNVPVIHKQNVYQREKWLITKRN